jgi:hypothetical protein
VRSGVKRPDFLVARIFGVLLVSFEWRRGGAVVAGNRDFPGTPEARQRQAGGLVPASFNAEVAALASIYLEIARADIGEPQVSRKFVWDVYTPGYVRRLMSFQRIYSRFWASTTLLAKVRNNPKQQEPAGALD